LELVNPSRHIQVVGEGKERKMAYVRPRIQWYPLARRVLVVAAPMPHDPEKWTAYIDAVPGKNHQSEEWWVRQHGVKLHVSVAQAIFPEFDPEEYWK
jgi:hypothetical protein